MGFMEKLKNIFFEEEEEEEIQEVKPPKKDNDVIATKVDVPKSKKENLELEEFKPVETRAKDYQERSKK